MRYPLIALLIVFVLSCFAFAQDIPTIDSPETVQKPAEAAEEFNQKVCVELFFRVLMNDGSSYMGQRSEKVVESADYQSIVQKITLAPARSNPDGTTSLYVTQDLEKLNQIEDLDVRAESVRSPVFKTMISELLNIIGLVAKEKQLTAEIDQLAEAIEEAVEPERSALEAEQATLVSQRAALRQALQITE